MLFKVVIKHNEQGNCIDIFHSNRHTCRLRLRDTLKHVQVRINILSGGKILDMMEEIWQICKKFVS